MKAILLSVPPEYLAGILNGKKTIEIRKSKLPLNIPVYLYYTKELSEFNRCDGFIDYCKCKYFNWKKLKGAKK